MLFKKKQQELCRLLRRKIYNLKVLAFGWAGTQPLNHPRHPCGRAKQRNTEQTTTRQAERRSTKHKSAAEQHQTKLAEMNQNLNHLQTELPKQRQRRDEGAAQELYNTTHQNLLKKAETAKAQGRNKQPKQADLEPIPCSIREFLL
jgi:TolA-binding protein